MSKLGLILPTRSRPANLVKVFEAWSATRAWDDADMIVVVDNDDPTFPGYMGVMMGAPAGASVIQIPKWKAMVPKLNDAAKRLAVTGEYSALGFAGDDHLPRTDRWSRIYLDALAELGTGIVHGNDLYQGENLPTEWAMTVDIVQTLGCMVPAPVDHLYCDNAVKMLGTRAKCLRYLSDVVIEHNTPYAQKTSFDAQYRRVNSRQQYSKDGLVFRRWVNRDLPRQARLVQNLVDSKVEP